MELIKHTRKNRAPLWEVNLNGESVTVTTRELLRQSRFSHAVLREAMNSTNTQEHMRAFAPLTSLMPKEEWLQMLFDAMGAGFLAGLQS